MRVTEVAQQIGISRDTILRFERLGWVKPARDWNGHRRYSRRDLEALRKIVYSRQQPKGERGVDQP